MLAPGLQSDDDQYMCLSERVRVWPLWIVKPSSSLSTVRAAFRIFRETRKVSRLMGETTKAHAARHRIMLG